jgi:V/A-type H+-transporting ATPase subunit E
VSLEDALRADTAAQVKRIREEAAGEACRLLSEARAEADDLRTQAAADQRDEAQKEANRITRQAQQQAAGKHAAAVDEATDDLIERVRQGLHALREDGAEEYVSALKDLHAEALSAAREALGEGAELVTHVHPDDTAHIDGAQGSLDGLGGVLVTSADGRIRFDNTFESRIEAARPHLRRMVRDA